MVTLRCTRSVRDRLHLPRQTVPEPPPSTGRLGDWYIHLVRFGRPEFAIATSERSLLTVLFPARALRTTLAPNLRGAVGSLLDRGDDLLTISRRLADTPMSAIGAKRWDYGHPGKLARELLTASVD